MPKDNRTPTTEFSRNPSRGTTSDFSRIATRYDATRDLPESILDACYEKLIRQGFIPSIGKILDAGCGTGQVSMPLARRGSEVHGIDVSSEMTVLAQMKVDPTWRATYSTGDVRNITADNDTFDAAVVSKLFQHVQDWQGACRELIRVVRPGCHIVQINERGAFGNAVRRYFSRIADERGFRGRYVGLNPHTEDELTAFMESLDCRSVAVDTSDLRWEMSISYEEAFERIREGLFAEFWYLPTDAHQVLIADTLTWIDAQPNGRKTVQHLKPYLAVTAFRTPGVG
jgi:ubiquinone/menaquinone biosynthesis C-methylase UbiE